MTGLQVTEKPKSSSLVSSERIELKTKEFLVTFNPDTQMKICSDTRVCITGQYPTLAEVRRDYGTSVPTAWLVPQLQDLSWYCGARDKLNARQLEECAYVIASDFSYLKVSELMLFFHRFKSGRYGKFYGTVDPLVICQALREFVKERNSEIEKIESEERQREREEHAKTAVSWKEYCIMTGQPERINNPIPQEWNRKKSNQNHSDQYSPTLKNSEKTSILSVGE